MNVQELQRLSDNTKFNLGHRVYPTVASFVSKKGHIFEIQLMGEGMFAFVMNHRCKLTEPLSELLPLIESEFKINKSRWSFGKPSFNIDYAFIGESK